MSTSLPPTILLTQKQIALIDQQLEVMSPQAMLNATEQQKLDMQTAKQGLEAQREQLTAHLAALQAQAGQTMTGTLTPFVKPQKTPAQQARRVVMSLLGATAMAVSYSRNKSIWKSIGAGIVSVPYLIYVYIDTRKEKK